MIALGFEVRIRAVDKEPERHGVSGFLWISCKVLSLNSLFSPTLLSVCLSDDVLAENVLIPDTPPE